MRRKVQQQNFQQNLQESRSHCTSEPKLSETETPPQRRKLSQRRTVHHHGKEFYESFSPSQKIFGFPL